MSLSVPTNYFGQKILKPYQLSSPNFGTGIIKNGIPEVDWKGCRTSCADEHGFDIRNVEKMVNIPSSMFFQKVL